MPEVVHRPVGYALKTTLGEVVRELNFALRDICQKTTENFWNGYPQVDWVTSANGTFVIWLPLASYRIDTISVYCSAGTANVTPRINGTNMTVTGGVPITATTTATTYAITAANTVVALNRVDIVVAAMGVANLTVALGVRRTG